MRVYRIQMKMTMTKRFVILIDGSIEGVESYLAPGQGQGPAVFASTTEAEDYLKKIRELPIPEGVKPLDGSVLDLQELLRRK